MRIPFRKMNGAGNDFVMIDNRNGDIHLEAETIKGICDRKRGIGADGIILLESSEAADFRMRYYNRDGGEVEMCGNGARCVALFAKSLGLGNDVGDETRLSLMAQPGRMEARVQGERVAVSMTDATGFETITSLEVANGEENVHVINTGVPHAVTVEPDADALTDREISERGSAVRYHSRFAPSGLNVNFVTPKSDGCVVIRTYERGVEAETLACGTGSVATAVVLAHLGIAKSPVTLRTRGGDLLTVSFELNSAGAVSVVLEGPANFNFDGTVNINGN